MKKNFVKAFIAMAVFAGVVLSCKVKPVKAQVSNSHSQSEDDTTKKAAIFKPSPEKQIQGEWAYFFEDEENENSNSKIPAELYVFKGKEYIHYYLTFVDKGIFSISEESISLSPEQVSSDIGESWHDIEEDELNHSIFGNRTIRYSFLNKETLILPYQPVLATNTRDEEFKKGEWQDTFKSFFSSRNY